MTLFAILGVLLGGMIIVGAMIAIVSEAIYSKPNKTILSVSPPEFTAATPSSTTVAENGITLLKILGTEVTGNIDFTEEFSSTPNVVSAVLDTAYLGTPTATLDDFTVANTSSASANVTLANYPLANPQNRTFVAIPGATANVYFETCVDSNKQVWIGHSNDNNIYAFKRTTESFVDVGTATGTTVSDAAFVGVLRLFEVAGNIFAFYVAASFSGVFRYGPIGDTTLPSTVQGLPSTTYAYVPTVDPMDNKHVLLPFYNLGNTEHGIYESFDGGLTYTNETVVSTGGFYMGIQYYNDTNAILLVRTGSTGGWTPYHYDGSSWTTLASFKTSIEYAVLNTGLLDRFTKFDDTLAYVFKNNTTTKGKSKIYCIYCTAPSSSIWTYPMLVGDFVEEGGYGLVVGSSNGIPWVLCHSTTNVYASYNDQANGRGTWATPFVLLTCTNIAGGMAVTFTEDGLVITTYDGSNAVLNFVPTAARVIWEVEES